MIKPRTARLAFVRWLPVVLGLMCIAAMAVTHLAASPRVVTYGQTTTLSFTDGPPVLVTVDAVRLTPASRRTPGELLGAFKVELRLARRTDSLVSPDALASFCSVVGRDGIAYPSDLRLSDPSARRLFRLDDGGTRAGSVVSALPVGTSVAGVRCQLGVTFATWTS